MSTIKLFFTYLIVAVLLIANSSGIASAVDESLLDFYSSNDISFYDAEDCIGGGGGSGNTVPVGGQTTAATTYGGSFYKSENKWYPNNAVQGAPKKGLPAIPPDTVIKRYNAGFRFNQGANRYDDNGFGNDGKPLAGSMSFAELSKNPSANDFSALGKLGKGAKIRVHYKGKSIVVEKRDVGSGGAPYKGTAKKIDLWWEAAKVLEFTNGTDLITWEKVPDSTPTTPINGPADNSNGSSASDTAASQDAPTTQGSDNTETILNFYASKGLSVEAAAGIAGNYWQESRHNPRTIQRFNGESVRVADDSYVMEKDRGFGLAQWTFPTRQQELAKFAREKNKPITDISIQLEFSWKEMNEGIFKSKGLVDQLKDQKSAKDPAYAAYIFHKIYEGSADTEEEVRKNRGKVAVDLFNKYKGRISGSYSGDEASTCGAGNQAGNSDTSKASYVTPDGFAIYKQGGAPYGGISITRSTGATTTIGRSGCGAMSFAMAYTHLTGKAIDIQQLAKHVSSTKTMSASGGFHQMSVALAKKYPEDKIKAKVVGKISASEVSDFLRTGGVVQVVGSGAPPFTGGGHFVLIRGITPSGNWLIGNSAGGKAHIATSNNTEGYSPSRIHNGGARNYIKIWKE